MTFYQIEYIWVVREMTGAPERDVTGKPPGEGSVSESGVQPVESRTIAVSIAPGPTGPPKQASGSQVRK